MTHLDPVAASQVRACIDRKVEQLWRQEHTDHDGPVPRRALSDERLRAQAMVEFIRAGHAAPAGTRGHADVLVLIDYQTLLGQLTLAGRCELGDGTPLPASEARRLACESRIIPVVMSGGSLPLDVGRSSRLASGAQRAAARAVHDTSKAPAAAGPLRSRPMPPWRRADVDVRRGPASMRPQHARVGR